MNKRVLGQTGELLSMVGFGGILVTDEEPAVASCLVAEAIERGVNYFDVAPTYGNAEERLGPALEPYRKDVFLACKTTQRLAEGAAFELERSLQRLRTDHFDLYQCHSVTTLEDVEQITGPGGALEVFLQAQKDGRVRHIGFSAHSEEAALALMERHPFTSILYPVNWVTWHQGPFGARTMARARELGMGVLALKTMAKRKIAEGEPRPWKKCWYVPAESYDEAELGFRFTFSRPVTAGPCPGHAHLFRWMCDAAERFTPLSPQEEQMVMERGRELAPIFPR